MPGTSYYISKIITNIAAVNDSLAQLVRATDS